MIENNNKSACKARAKYLILLSRTSGIEREIETERERIESDNKRNS